ncbi:MAG: nicotinate (nicotinamide) nucleotide adenylyltransferase [Lachnospiraceae bacterium]|nr:nicotinate (nicotinamide) nucleotide adenylyltransferase [Lachnospiraceae bacterium]
MERRQRIGLFGGTFNPPHLGHLKMSKAAKDQFSLDEIWFIPSGTPPHKKVDNEVSASDRAEMCRALLYGENGILSEEEKEFYFVDDIEVRSITPNYSYKTVSMITSENPDKDFFFIIGEDSLRYFHKWVKPEVIAENVTILVASRNESNGEKKVLTGDFIDREEMTLPEMIDYLKENVGGTYEVIKFDPVDISSSEIRSTVTEPGFEAEKFINDDVYQYIKEHGLYREAYDNEYIENIRKDLKDKLKSKRYLHTLGVMHTASSLAMRYSYPVSHAVLAGLLHDCTKYLNDDEQLKYCKKNNIEITDSEKKAPQILHAKTGAFEAEKEYKVKDKDILHAINVHTTGAPGMNLLDKILFTADYIEAGRCEAPRLNDIRNTAFNDLDLAVTMILSDTINYLKEKDKSMDPRTFETYEYYKNLIEQREFARRILELVN